MKCKIILLAAGTVVLAASAVTLVLSRVAGYIEPYYYSQVYEDEENGRLRLMRFRL